VAGAQNACTKEIQSDSFDLVNGLAVLNRWCCALGLALVLSCASISLCAQQAAQKVQRQLERVQAGTRSGPFTADWNSLGAYRVPEWFRDAKFGIFIHWGVYSVPAFGNEWYPRNMYQQGNAAFKHHVETYGSQSKFGYKDFIPMFRAEHFNADAWVDLFARASARYIVPVGEHCDGFAMYDSNISDWNSAKMGSKRDVVGELARATANETCASVSLRTAPSTGGGMAA
jgi:alpha-L-fucosidase